MVEGPSSLEEGSPYHLVKPRSQRDGRMFRPVILVASALALSCVVAVVVSSGPSRSVLQATGISSEVPLAMMPDPAEAVHVAQETVAQANAFHRGGSWIVPKDYDQHKVPKLVMEPRYAMREGQEAADHASRQPYAVPLSRYGSPVPGDKVAALGQYVPMKQISNNPLAQFIPNITYWPNGDIVPFWDGPCEDDDIECELWKAKGYDTGEYVMPNPREHVDHDRWGLPLKKFGSVGKTEDSIILGEMKIEQEEMDQGVPLNVAEADAMAVLEEVVEASGVNPGTAKIEVEKALEDKNILEAAQEGEETEEQANAVLAAEEQQTQATSMEEMETQMAEAQQISANSLAKLDALRTAMARMAGRAAPAAEGGEGVAAPSEVPMVTSVGPAGDFSGQAQVASAVEPANADVEMISPVYKGPMASSVVAPVMVPQTYTQAGAFAGAAAAMQQIRAAQLQRAKVAGYLLKPMYTTP